MIQIPPTDSIATAAVAVGALFLLRYFFVMRRVWKRTGRRQGFQAGDYFRAMRPGAFGEEFEPERRYAKRQLILGAIFLAIGLLFFAWLLAVGAPIGMTA